ncbi:hypothetical protein JCM8208_006527 [Rhodotorula glutinis]
MSSSSSSQQPRRADFEGHLAPRPPRRAPRQHHDAPYDALIFDSSPSTHDQWTAFADDVARALLEAQQCDTIGELFRREHKAALDRGEMRLSFRDDLRSCAAEVERRAGAGGAGGDEPERRSAFRCEDEWTARGIFREA